MKYPGTVEKYPDNLKELARYVCNLRYDRLAEFLGYCGEYLREDSIADAERGYPQVSNLLDKVSDNIGISMSFTERLWRICKPHMEDTTPK